MDYRSKAIHCVKNTVLPIQEKQFKEWGCSLDEQYKKYGDTEGFFGKVIDPGHIYEVGYPKCVCPDVCSGKQRIKRTVNVPDKAYYIFWSIYYQTKELP